MAERGQSGEGVQARAPLFDELRSGRRTARLRIMFLVPLISAILLGVGAFVLDIYHHERRNLAAGIIRVRTSAVELLAGTLRRDGRVLGTVMDGLAEDLQLHAALAAGARQALLVRSEPLFRNLKRDAGITHIYFHRPDRTVLLRVHQPARFGDRIDRTTLVDAERLGGRAVGLELGPLGTLTLRLVEPWRDPAGAVVGYVEVGMEIDQALESMRELLHLPLVVLVEKRFLDRAGWEEGMRALGRDPQWDRFPQVVSGLQATELLPESLADYVRHGGAALPDGPVLSFTGPPHWALFIPVRDARGVEVAHLVLVMDVTAELRRIRQALLIGSGTAASGAAVLLAIFYWLAGRLGRRIERDEQELARLATRDGLTDLYNHRTFYAIADEELVRFERYRRPFSLLMLDLDWFKRVNDGFGHVAGDRVLAAIGQYLKQTLRPVDRPCRYGGEEIAVLLPEVGPEEARFVAERLRAEIEAMEFDIGREQPIHITVSVGVASLPMHAATIAELVAAADTALYAAKERGRNRVEVSAAAAAA